VTGANGLIASQVAVALLEKGFHVNAAVRDVNDPTKTFLNEIAESLGVADHIQFFAIPNLAEDVGFAEAFEGCEYVMHIASPVFVSSDNPERDVIQPAVNGTLNAMRAALNAGVKHIIVTSSVAAMLGNQRDTNPEYVLNEEDWNEHPGSSYSRSKVLAERAAWDFVKENPSLHLTVICPALVLGPISHRNSSLSSVTRVFDILKGGEEQTLVNAKYGIVDIRDVVKVCVKAIEDERAINQRYLIANTPQYGSTHIARVLNEHCGFNFPTEYKEPQTFVKKSMDNSKVVEFLGEELIPMEQSIVETYNSLVSLGLFSQ